MPMIRAFSGGIMRWLGAGALIALLLGAGYAYHDWVTSRLLSKVQTLEAELKTTYINRDDWRRSSKSYEALAEKLTSEKIAADTALRALHVKLNDQQAAYKTLRQAVRAAPKSDDAPVAPVLRSALEGLP